MSDQCWLTKAQLRRIEPADRLAHVVLMLSSAGSEDAERLKWDALHILAIACIDLRD